MYATIIVYNSNEKEVLKIMKKSPSSIFKQNILISSLIVIIYSLAIIISTSFILVAKSNEIENLNIERQLDIIANEVETELQSSLKTLDFIAQSNNIRKYLNTDDSSFKYFMPILNEITSNLTYYNQINILMGFSKITDKLIVTNNGYFELNTFFDTISLDYNEIFKQYSQMTNNSILMIEHLENKILLIKKYLINQQNFIGIISVPIQNIFLQNDIFYIQLNEQTIGNNFIDNSLHTYKLSDENRYALSRQYNISSRELDTFPNINILMKTPINKYHNFIKKFTVPLLVLFSILFLIGFFIVRYSSKRLYSPIKNITTFLNESQTSLRVPGTFNEEEIIKSTISELRLNNDMLKEIADETFNYRRIEFLENIKRGNIVDPTKINQGIKMLNMNQFQVGAFLTFYSITFNESIKKNWSTHELMQIASKTLTLSYHQETNLDSVIIPLDIHMYILISYLSNKNNVPLMRNITSNEFFTSVEPLHTEFIGNIQNLKIGFDKGMKKITQFKEKKQNFPIKFTLEDENLINQAISLNDYNLALNKIKDILYYNLMSDTQITSIIVGEFKYIMLNTLTRLLNQHNIEFKKFANDNYELFNALNNNSVTETYSTLLKIFEILLTSVIKFDEIKDPTTINIIKYIESNAYDELSLTQVADYFNLSEQHISRLLKQNSNIRFKTYLTKLKMDKAKDLLINSNLKIADIAEKIGYTSANSFIRSFKKEFGMSPKEYAKLYSKHLNIE